MEKTYKTKLHGYSIAVEIDGKKKSVIFKRDFIGISSLIGCVYKTEDTELQKALEAHRDFGQIFWTDDVEDIKKGDENPKGEVEGSVEEKKRGRKPATKK